MVAAFAVATNSFAQTKWIKAEQKSDLNVLEIGKLDATFRILSCEYDNSKLKTLNSLTSKNMCGWALSTNKNGNNEIEYTFTATEDKHTDSGVAIALDFNSWSSENYVMIPASVYNGNRNRIVKREYAQGLDRSDLYNKNLPLTTASVPQLSPDNNTPSLLEVNVSNTTTPAICLFDKEKKRGLILLTNQGIKVKEEIIDNAIIVEENESRTKASFVISAPGVRELKPEFIGFSTSPDRGVKFKKGDNFSMTIKIHEFSANDISDVLDKFMSVRKEVTGANSPRNLIPFSHITKIMTKNIDNRYYKNDNFEYYCPENANWISFGWIGGLMNTYPMLALGDSEHRQKVANTFDFALKYGVGESGYFYGALGSDAKPFGREGYDETPEIVLTRKNADVLYWMVKQLMLLEAQGNSSTINKSWKESVIKLADAFCKTWKKEGEWGNFVNNKSGDVVVYNTTSGAAAIGGLALASQYFGNQNYLEVAQKSASKYYNEHFLKLGMTTGGCADILQNADSETASAFMTSLMTLYEVTNDIKYLEQSRNLANLCASWSVSFDYILPKDSPLAKLDARLAGAVWASTQNKHGAPGFCTLSGDAIFKIYRATKDSRYADLMYDIIHAHAEGIQPNGLITERLTYCDADSRGSRGDGGKTGWNETNGALMAIEIPGIYINRDKGDMYVFDHVDAKILGTSKSGTEIEITNPTEYDAEVTVLCETDIESMKPLGDNSFLKWKKVKVSAKSTITAKI